MKLTATFVRSAAGAGDFPRDVLAEIALVGRSNVGKSSLINALVRRTIARTSGAPGKTRLANIYRVDRREAGSLYLVDLPGYGYARGRSSAGEFEALTSAYFGRSSGREGLFAALLLVDARHPGIANDLEAWTWLQTVAPDAAPVATKIDKLARGERIRAMRELESVLEHSVLPVSAVTGEGLDELWILIDRLATPRPLASRKARGRSNSSSRQRPHPEPQPQRPGATDTTAARTSRRRR